MRNYADSWHLDDLIEEYHRYQRDARGLSEATLRGYASDIAADVTRRLRQVEWFG